MKCSKLKNNNELVNEVHSGNFAIKLTILDVGPLFFLPFAFHVLELVLDVGLPGNVIICNRYVINLHAGIRSPKLKCIIEVALGDEATWEGCRILNKQGRIIVGVLDPVAEVAVLRDGLTVA